MATNYYPGYEAELRDFHLAFSLGGALTSITLVLLGVGLDFALYPILQFQFAFARLLVALLTLLVIFLLRTSWGHLRVSWLTFLWLLFPQFMIAWMISVTEGVDSIYYAGLNLAIFASGIALGFGVSQNILFGALSYLLYVLACLAHPRGMQPFQVFAVNSLFLIFSSSASAVYTLFNERARYMLYRLKSELAAKNAELELINRNLAEIKGQMLQQEKMAAVGTLAAGLLHEVNNPVNFCLMAIEVAMEEPAAKASTIVLECLVDATEGMKRVQHIVSDLKTFAYRKPGMVSENAVFLFEKALETAVRLTGHEIKGILITRELPADTLVRGDEAAVIGVLINLLSNAALAMRTVRDSGMTIHVTAEWKFDRLQIGVRDNGPGIAPENVARVFEPFFTTREVGQGLGLGLSISDRVIEQHGGVLMAESCVGEWTRMIFDLPRAD
jgi:two-component system sensor histidine kinase PhcS